MDTKKVTASANRPKPPRAGMGRPKGSVNKTTSLLKDAILEAATQAGEGSLSDYLAKQAVENPGPFMSLLGKVLPLQVIGDLHHTHSVNEMSDDDLASIAAGVSSVK